MHRGPLPNTYHLNDGRLIAGEYPGSQDPDTARANLRTLIEAGVRTFIDLTEPHELEPYEQLLYEEASTLANTPRYLRLPIRDVSTPRTTKQMREILDAIDAGLDSGDRVYVHCWGGIGRTGTVIGCHLVRSGMSGPAAVAHVAELFASTEKSAYVRRSPETDAQVEYIRGWRESE